MLNTEIKGHQLQRGYLRKSVVQNKVANSYLFHGRDGIGKKKVAMEFASILNCTDSILNGNKITEECGCFSCQKIRKGVHPDVSLISSDGLKEIKVDLIRERIEELLYLKPYEGKYKVSIVDDAHLMNLNAQNAFLKTLEEPPANSIIILISSKPQILLQTIISRCQKIEFFSLSDDIIRDYLKELGYSGSELEQLVRISRGSLGITQLLDMDILRLRVNLIEQLSCFNSQDAYEICQFVDGYTKDKTPDNAVKINFVFEMLFLWLKDIMLIKNGIDKNYLLHHDLIDVSQKMASRWSYEELFSKSKFIENAREAIFNTNVNKQYIFENLAIEFSDSSYLKGG